MRKSKFLPYVAGAMALTQLPVDAQTPTGMDSVTQKTEQAADDVAKIFKLDSEGEKLDSTAMPPNTIDFFTAKEFEGVQGEAEGGRPSIEPDPKEGGENEEGDAGDSQSEKPNVSQGSKQGVLIGYNAAVGNKTYMRGTGSILGDDPSFSLGVNASFKDFSLGVSRGTDFSNSPKSNFTQMALSYNKKIGLSDDRNIYLGATGAYVHFDHSFNIADYGNVKLNETMGMVQFSLKGKVFSVGLGIIYNYFLNGITPNNLVTKLETGLDFNGTSLTAEGRLSVNAEGQKSLSAAIGLGQKLPEGFALYLGAFADNLNMLNGSDNVLKPKIVFNVSKNGVFSKGMFSKRKKK